MPDKPDAAIRIASITESTSRRDAIKVGLAALAGMGLTALAPREAFAAAGGNFILGQANDAGSANTDLTSSSGLYTLRLFNTDSSVGSVLLSSQIGGSSNGAVFLHSGSGRSVYVQQTGSGNGVFAEHTNSANTQPVISASTPGDNATAIVGASSSTTPNARGVKGDLTSTTAAGCAVEGHVTGSGGATGVWGNVGAGGTGPAVKATNAGTGRAFEAQVTNAASGAIGAYIATDGTGEALRADITSDSNGSTTARIWTHGTGSAITAESFKTDNSSATVIAGSYSTHSLARAIKGVLTDAAASGTAIEGYVAGGAMACGVVGSVGSGGNGWAVKGMNAGTGGGVRGEVTNAASSGVALWASTAGTGDAVRASVSNSSSTSSSVYAQTMGSGNAIWGHANNADSTAAGVLGTTASTSADARGLCGKLTDTAQGYAVEGRTMGSSGGAVLAVADTGSNALALNALSAGTGGAIKAAIDNASNAQSAITAVTNGIGYAVHAEGGKAQLYLKPAATAGAPTSGDHLLGEVFMDAAGALYTCVAAGTPGTWLPLAVNSGPAAIHDGANTAAVTIKSPSATSYAVKAQGNAANGAALRVEGKMTMTRSGKAKISKGKSTVYVTVPGGLTSSANILCTLQGSAGGGVYIKYAKRVSTTRFKIVLGKASGYTTYVGWMVLGG